MMLWALRHLGVPVTLVAKGRMAGKLTARIASLNAFAFDLLSRFIRLISGVR